MSARWERDPRQSLGRNPAGSHGQQHTATPKGCISAVLASHYTAIAAGDTHTCALQTSGDVLCWGTNQHGEIERPSGRISAISAGDRYNCGLRTDASIHCWGQRYDSTNAPPAGEFTTIASGYAHACALRVDGSVECWGWNGYGQTQPDPLAV